MTSATANNLGKIRVTFEQHTQQIKSAETRQDNNTPPGMTPGVENPHNTTNPQTHTQEEEDITTDHISIKHRTRKKLTNDARVISD